MKLNILKPKEAINKAFLKLKPNRTEVEKFKKNESKEDDKKLIFA